MDGEQLVTRAVVTYKDANGNTSSESSATTATTIDTNGSSNNSGTSSKVFSFLPSSFDPYIDSR